MPNENPLTRKNSPRWISGIPTASTSTTPTIPTPAFTEGIEAVRRQIGRWVEAYPDLQVDPLEIQINGDLAFVWVRFSGHGAGSGVPIDMELAHVLTIKGGKTRRLEEYSERADGLEAAGLSE